MQRHQSVKQRAFLYYHTLSTRGNEVSTSGPRATGHGTAGGLDADADGDRVSHSVQLTTRDFGAWLASAATDRRLNFPTIRLFLGATKQASAARCALIIRVKHNTAMSINRVNEKRTCTKKILVWFSIRSFRRPKYHVLRSGERGICARGCSSRGLGLQAQVFHTRPGCFRSKRKGVDVAQG